MGVLWQLEPATEAKHRLYKRYLDAWFPIFLQQPWVARVTYLDAFAGPGEYAQGEEGSPVFALDRLLKHEARARMNLSRQRVTMIFIEGDSARHRHLSELLVSRFGPLDELPVNVIVKHGRAEVDSLPLLTQVGAWGSPVLAVFDSWGNVGVPWQQLQTIAANPQSEVIVTFGPNWFSRREGEEPHSLDQVFGGPEHWSPSDKASDPTERWRAWLETYRRAVLRAGFKFCIPFQVLPKTGQPLNLVFGTGHDRAVSAFKDAMWKVDSSDGMQFLDPRTNAAKEAAMAAMRPTLFDDLDAPNPELLAFIAEGLGDGPKTLEIVRDFLLRETARWLPKHAADGIRYMVDEGRITRTPATGRLTRTTVLEKVPQPTNSGI